MKQGLISRLDNEEISDFVVDEIYPYQVMPLSCVLSGSRIYGLATEDSDYDYLGIHLCNSWECLEHPNYRQDFQVIRKKYSAELKPTVGEEKSHISLDSFEMWKFIDLIVKGAFTAYELLYLPEIHHAEGIDQLISLCRGCLTTKIAHSVKGMILGTWGKHPNNRKKAIMAYYRLAQVIYLLREGEFEWNVDALFDYLKNANIILDEFLAKYKNQETRNKDMLEKEATESIGQISFLLNEVGRALITTSLPKEVPVDILQNLLGILKKTRAQMI